MRRRITLAIVLVTALAVALFGIPLAVVLRHLYITNARATLVREATLAARDIPADFANETDPIDLPTSRAGIAVGLYTLDGHRLSGAGPSEADVAVRDALASRVADVEEGDHLVAAIPVAVNETVVAAVRAETSVHPAERRAYRAWALMAMLGVVVIAFAGALGAALATRLTRPLRRVSDSATRLGHGDFTITVPRTGVAELDDVGDALTTTASRLGRAMEREQSFSTHASHQLRTPIAGLRLTIETELADPRTDPTLALHECLVVADRLESTVNDLLRLSREPAADQHVDVTNVLAAAGARWHGLLAASGRPLRIDTSANLPQASASQAAITQALDVLVDNAMRHGRGEVSVRAERVGGGVVITVTDEGNGNNGLAPRATNAGRVDDHGIGLGLARTLVEADGGRVLLPEPGAPSTYSIVLRASTSDDNDR